MVRDSAGRPLVDAVVTLDPNEAFRSARTDAQGRFRFRDVRPGDYELRTVWLGYRPDDRTIIVPREGLDVAIVLARLPFQLDTMRVVARRTGIIGTAVQQADFRALGGVDVEILGTRHRLRTKADGLFNFDVREGSYVLLGRRSGFASRMIPVPVPSEEAVEVALAMDTAETKAETASPTISNTRPTCRTEGGCSFSKSRPAAGIDIIRIGSGADVPRTNAGQPTWTWAVTRCGRSSESHVVHSEPIELERNGQRSTPIASRTCAMKSTTVVRMVAVR
jgi:hypothetical protein